MAYTKKRNEKDGTLYLSVEGEKAGIPLVCLSDATGAPYAAGGGGGGSFDGQLTQGGADVSSGNPLPVYDMNPGASVNEWTDYGGKGVVAFGVSPTGKQTALRTDADSQLKTIDESIATDTGAKASKVTVIGGHNGSNSYGWHVNASGQGKVINDSLGDPTDAVATTDTGTWSIPALLKKLNQSITSLLGRFGTLGQKAMSGSTPVVIASDQSSVPMTPRANGTGSGGTTFFKLISAASTNASTVKAGAGNLYSIHAINTNASAVRYLKLYNLAANPTVGTSIPVATFAIPGNSQGAGFTITFSMGPNFSTGIALAITAGVADNDTTAILANEVTVTLTYA